MNDGAEGATSLRDGLLAEHAEIERLLDDVMRAIEERSGASLAWRAFSSALLAQIDAEERHLVAALSNEGSARLLRYEHCYLRGRLRELGCAVDEEQLEAPLLLKNFRDVLRAHARNDDRLLYGWAETHLNAERRDAVLDVLTERRRVMAKR